MTVATLLRPGHNCHRTARASRAAVLIDGAAYFSAFAQAALRATRSIVIVGWDFDSRTVLHLGQPDVPDLLGEFLNFLARRRRGLYTSILIWDSPLVFSKGREPSPSYGLGWHPHRRVHFKYDSEYPRGAALHQKFVVVDGAVAFCGGLDLTRGRWDTPEHRPADPRRINPAEDRSYTPFHDAMLMVEGKAAHALHDLASKRWRQATGKHLPRILNEGQRNQGHGARGIRRAAGLKPTNLWPEAIPAAFSNIEVGIARTVPSSGGTQPVAEIQALHLDLIASAKHYIYLENQYFSANTLGDALAARLAEPEGPEIVAVLRQSSAGWLEAPTMGTLRTVLLRKLRAADRYGRFHAYYSHIPGLEAGECCDLHTKLMIVDDEWLRLGSANFANRSMWLDTECDLVLEASGDPVAMTAMARVRNLFLGEHLDACPQSIEDALKSTGSLGAAIERLARPGGRTLKRFEQLEVPSEALVAASGIADPAYEPMAAHLMTGPRASDNLAAHTSHATLAQTLRRRATALLSSLISTIIRWFFRPGPDRLV